MKGIALKIEVKRDIGFVFSVVLICIVLYEYTFLSWISSLADWRNEQPTNYVNNRPTNQDTI